MIENRLGVSLQRVQNVLARYMDHRARALNLTGTQLSIIDFINTHTKEYAMPIYQKDIEAEFNIRKATATNILKLMEQKNLLTRTPNQNDTRLKEIILTPAAQKLACQIKIILDEAEKKMVSLLGENGKKQLSSMLKSIEQSF